MGTEQQPYLTGPRVYDGSRSSPNLGRTSKPQGYVQREIKKQSQSRSGVAEQFLRARDAHAGQQDQQQQLPQQPLIPEPMVPIGNTGIFKDPTGRLYNGGSYQAQAAQATASQSQPGPSTTEPSL